MDIKYNITKLKGSIKEEVQDHISVEDFFSNTQIKINKEWQIFKKILNIKNISRKQCLLLPFKTIAKALKFNS